jgi:hypothetical protein
LLPSYYTKSLTPMKLLTTIAAVLISISAFSQDYVEYNEGTFTQNGEELSMEQVKDLIVLHKAGRGNVRRGINFDEMHKNPYLRGGNNTLNLVGGAGGTFVGGYIGLVGLLLTTGGFYIESVPVIGVPITATGTGLCIVSFRAFSRITLSKKGCLRKRDKQFNKVAGKLNEAIQSSNQ